MIVDAIEVGMVTARRYLDEIGHELGFVGDYVDGKRNALIVHLPSNAACEALIGGRRLVKSYFGSKAFAKANVPKDDEVRGRSFDSLKRALINKGWATTSNFRVVGNRLFCRRHLVATWTRSRSQSQLVVEPDWRC